MEEENNSSWRLAWRYVESPWKNGYDFHANLVCVHSDLANAKNVLRMASIIDETGHWIAGNDTLVQTGDMVDRGTYRYAKVYPARR